MNERMNELDCEDPNFIYSEKIKLALELTLFPIQWASGVI
jgi:hypothetical protein